MRDLCNPETPASKSFAEICVILDQHYTPPIIAYEERRRFFSAQKSGDESTGKWLVRLKFAASACDFINNIENVLLDKHIMGLDGRAFDRLCEENHKTLTLAKALELASKWEVRCILKITTSFSRFGNYLHFILDNTNFIDHQIVKN